MLQLGNPLTNHQITSKNRIQIFSFVVEHIIDYVTLLKIQYNKDQKYNNSDFVRKSELFLKTIGKTRIHIS